MISDAQLSILACPACNGGLLQTYAGDALLCPPCGLSFLVRNGIPLLLVHEAIKIQGQETRDKVC